MLVNKQSICTRALRLIGAIGAGDTPDADDLADAVTVFDEMWDGWRADRLTIVVVERSVFSLVSNTQAYTIGPGGDFDHARPLWLDRASIISNTGAQPLELPMRVLTVGDWQNIPIKSTQSSLPRKLWYDFAFPTSGANAGLGNVHFYPVPNVGNLQTALYLPTPLDEMADNTTQYDMPPGYARALRYNLAVELAPEHQDGASASDDVVRKADKFLGEIRDVNIHPEIITVDEALLRRRGGGYFNYYTGQ